MSDTIPIVFHAFQTDHGAAQPVKSSHGGNTSVNNFRRSHKKSRGGCTRCKSRRIKCGEEKPTCVKCERRGLSCTYSTSPEPNSSEDASSLSPIKKPKAYPSIVSDTFTIEDMRLFYHFLLKSKPHIPVGNDEVWSREVPQYAFHNQYLMQSMLASAASHLSRATEDESLQLQAITYRSRGLKGLRKAILVSNWGEGHADSLIAATTSLMMQSAHFNDGFHDWLTLIKLQQTIVAKVRDSNQAIPVSFDMRPERHYQVIEPYLTLLPCVQPELVSAGLSSLRKFKHILTDHDDLGFYEVVYGSYRGHQESPQIGYLAFGFVFKYMYDLQSFNYYKLANPDNPKSQVLFAYFICALAMLMPLGTIENFKNVEWGSKNHARGFLGWLHGIIETVPDDLQEHLNYPRAIYATALAEIDGRPFAGPPVLQFNVAKNLAKEIKRLELEKLSEQANSQK